VTPRLWFRPRAAQEARDAARWYDERSPSLGLEFTRALDAATEAIARYREAFPLLRGDVRRALLRRFPYAVFFAVTPESIVVLSIVHCRRDPRRWPTGA